MRDVGTGSEEVGEVAITEIIVQGVDFLFQVCIFSHLPIMITIVVMHG